MMESLDNNLNDGSLNVGRDDAAKNTESSATRSLKSEDDKREHILMRVRGSLKCVRMLSGIRVIS